MSQSPDETPADEYLRRLAERRESVGGRLAKAGGWFVLGLVAAVGTWVFAAATKSQGQVGPGAAVLGVVWAGGIAAAVVSAGFSACVALANARDLSFEEVAMGLIPWLVVVAIVTAVFLAT